MNYDKILIIQTAFPGDVILTTPLIRTAKETFPEAKVSALVIPEAQELLKNNPYLEKIMVYDKRKRGKFWPLIKELKKENFDLALVPHLSLRSALIAFLSAKKRVGFDLSAGKLFLTDVVTYRKDWHEIERNLSLLSFACVKAERTRPELFPSSIEYVKVSGFLQEHGASLSHDIVCIAPGSVWATKRWLPERFAQVADWLAQREGIRVVIIGSEFDYDLAKGIARQMSKEPVIACGRLSLLESAALISKSKLLISNDSAPTHMAVAMGTPVVAIFGSTVPEFGFYPLGKENEVIQKPLYCRPCGIHGRRRCPEGHFRCMREISAEEVYQVVQRRLNEPKVKTD